MLAPCSALRAAASQSRADPSILADLGAFKTLLQVRGAAFVRMLLRFSDHLVLLWIELYACASYAQLLLRRVTALFRSCRVIDIRSEYVNDLMQSVLLLLQRPS